MYHGLFKIMNIGLIALILLSIIYVPSATIVITADRENQTSNVLEDNDGGDNASNETESEEDIGIEINARIPYDRAIQLAYDVRNVSYPIIEWGMNHNVTIAETILRVGDSFLNRSKSEAAMNKTPAAIHAMVAAIHYSHAPVIAYPVLSTSMKQYAGQHNYTSELITECIINKSKELKEVLLQAVGNYTNLGYELPEGFEDEISIIEQQINEAEELLGNGNVTEAHRQAMRIYHDLVVLYAKLIKAVFAETIGINSTERVTPNILRGKALGRELNFILDKLPEHVREKVVEKLKNKEHVHWKEFMGTILEVTNQYREQIREKVMERIVGIIFSVVMRASQLPGDTGKVIMQWRLKNHLMDALSLRSYIVELVKNVTKENEDLTGIELLKECLRELSEKISLEMGVEVDLEQVLDSMIKMHIIPGKGRR
ncbi:MAG: hypothetical protein J7L82_06865 [Staphylothermus sp.]|nr:hypothetical protein [Staphylothermus sp.]